MLQETIRPDGSPDIHLRITPIVLRHFRRYEFARDHLTPVTVLDVASGSGYGKDLLGPDFTYVGIDAAPEAVKYANQAYGNGHFHQGDINHLQYADEYFDNVVSMETLEHLDEAAPALSELRRVLKPGGRLAASIPLNHPDLVHHKRVYCFSEAKALFTGMGLSRLDLYLQTHMRIEPVTVEPDDQSAGTLVVIGRK